MYNHASVNLNAINFLTKQTFEFCCLHYFSKCENENIFHFCEPVYMLCVYMEQISQMSFLLIENKVKLVLDTHSAHCTHI